MLAYCELSTADSAETLGVSANFAVFDASSDSPDDAFDLVASSLAFQWVEDFQGLINRLASSIAPNGTIAFATLAEGTFKSISEIFAEYDLTLPTPKFPDAAELKRSLAGFDIREFRVETTRSEFDSMLDFLRHLRGIGAGNATGKPLSTAKLAKLTRERGNDPVSAEYEIVTTLCRLPT
jgi:malonyl-CoA O-methyltransferase